MPPSFDADIDLFAELSARLDDLFADRAGVLLTAALDEPAFVRLQARWMALLQQPSDDGVRLAQRFAEAYERTRQALEAARRGDKEGDGKRAPDPRFLSAQAQSWREEAAVVALSVSADAAPPVLNAASPALFRGDPLPTPLPIAEPPAMSPWLPVGLRGLTDLAGTQLDLEDPPAGPVLPFDPWAKPQLPEPTEASSLLPKGMRGITDLGGTQLDPGMPASPALPFNRPGAPQVPTSAVPEPWLPWGLRGITDLQGTQRIPDDLPSAPALPFELTGAKAEPLPILSPLPSPKPALDAPALSLEQYASLHVELDGAPANRTEVLQKYRVREDQLRGLDAHWRARFAADPSLKPAWERAYAAYGAWLLSTRPKRR